MPLYRIERRLGEISLDEIDAAAFRATSFMPAFAGMRWVRSFYDAQAYNLTCFYEAPSPDDISRHAQMARIPCDSVTEVQEYLPDKYR